MVNPFDRTFFKFLLGFILILLASFGVLYLANNASFFSSPTPENLTATQNK